MKKVTIELYVDEVNDSHVGQALGEAIISNRLYYKEAGNEESQIKLNKILNYCYHNVEKMWAASIIGEILDCDFRDAKREAEFFMGLITEEEWT